MRSQCCNGWDNDGDIVMTLVIVMVNDSNNGDGRMPYGGVVSCGAHDRWRVVDDGD